VAQAKWLPQYKKEVRKARKRLASEKPLGTRKWKGAARLHTKSVAEMRKQAAEHRRQAAAADKAAEQRSKDAAEARKRTSRRKKRAPKKK
jgi:alpha-galactosidase